MPYVIKTAPAETAVGTRIEIIEPAVYEGQFISRGDEAFLWFDILKGGNELALRSTVVEVTPKSGGYRVVVEPIKCMPKGTAFGNAQLDNFDDAPKGSPEHELYRKVRRYALDGIRKVTDDAASILRNQFEQIFELKQAEDDAQNEIERRKRLGAISSRLEQKHFSTKVRVAYQNKCAITGCTTPEALEAAHIRTEEGRDYNGLTNGILLRADIHALFDAGLITLSPDGSRVECSVRLADETYRNLCNEPVYRPARSAPSAENINHHRGRFGFAN